MTGDPIQGPAAGAEPADAEPGEAELPGAPGPDRPPTDDRRAAVLARFGADRRRRRRRRTLIGLALVAVVAASAATTAGLVLRASPEQRGALRFVDDVSNDGTGHLRSSHVGPVDVVIYDSVDDVNWVSAYAQGHAGDRLCLEGRATGELCLGVLVGADDGTTVLGWSGMRNILPYDHIRRYPADHSASQDAALELQTPVK